MKKDKCYYCGEFLGFSTEYYKVMKAVKPPKEPYRSVCIGHACEHCIDVENKPCVIDRWRTVSK